MILCIPVTQDLGLRSPLSRHFGSAPIFMSVDTASLACRAIPNRDRHHEHGQCQPLQALAGEPFEAVVVGGIGAGALRKLGSAGLRVFLSEDATIEAALASLQSGLLPEATPETACSHHGGGHHDHEAPGTN